MFMHHTTENSLPEKIRNLQEVFGQVNFGIPNTLPNCVIFLLGDVPSVFQEGGCPHPPSHKPPLNLPPA